MNRSGASDKPSMRHCAAFTLVELIVVMAILVALAGIVVPLLDSQASNAKSVVEQPSMINLRNAWVSMIQDVKYTFPATGANYTNLQMSDLLANPAAPTAPRTAPFPAWNPNTQIGWRGPYVQGGVPILVKNSSGSDAYPNSTDDQLATGRTFQFQGFYFPSANPALATLTAPNVAYGSAGQPAIGDSWGNPIVLQVPAVSATDPELATPAQCWHFARLVSAGPDGILGTDPNNKLAGRLSNNSIDYTKRGQDDIVLFLNREDVYEP